MISIQRTKTWFIMANRFFTIMALFLSICATANAQEISDILFGQNNKEDYMGQYNYNGKRKNVFGIERYKNGAVYIGDFVENEISGRGMLISLKKEISNVDGAFVYVGSWREGKKSGRGVCYDASGKVVYSGKFVNDKPSESSSADSKNRFFVIKDVGKNLYLGEMSGNRQDGFGLTLNESGEIVYGSMKNGVRQGIGMVFYSPEVWEVGRWTDGKFSAIKNSQKANADIASFRASNKEQNRIMREQLFAAAENFAQAGLNVATMVNEINGGGASSGEGGDEAVDGSVPSGKSKSYYQAQYDKWESKARNTYNDRVRHKVNAKTAGDGRVATSDAKLLRQYQKAMRQVRLQAQKEGFSIPQSEYETASF